MGQISSTLFNGRTLRNMNKGRSQRVCGDSRAMVEELESRMLLSVVGAASQLFIGLQPSNGFVKTSNGFALEVEVQDSSGNIVTTDTSKLSISVASGPGKLSGTTSVNAVGGVADFTHFIFSKTGTYTLTVSDGNLATATSGPIHINATAKATTLEFVQQPTDNASGSGVTTPVTVRVLDQYGNLFISPSQVQLKLFSGPSKSKLSGTLHAKTVAGIATFDTVTVSAQGSYVITAKEKGISINSDSFAMGGPPAATTLVFDQGPSDATAGAAITAPITVEVDDQYGHLLTTDHSTIKLTVASGPASNQSFSASVKNGVATFSNVALDAAGTYTLSASDGLLTPVTSGTFNISAGAATHLAFTQVPANGTSILTAGDVDVQVEDQFNNLVVNDTSSVTVAYGTAPHGIAALSATVTANAGVATFVGLAFPLAGKYSLKATDTLLASATSNQFVLV